MKALPEPDAYSLLQSQRAEEHLRERIEANDGAISFAEFMHEALYAPGLGYYSAGAHKLGAGGDFVTAPEISPLFGRCIARQLVPALAAPGAEIMEFGAGTGKLAAQVLSMLDELDALPGRYTIIEVSPDLAERQQSYLQETVPDLAGLVDWSDRLPADFKGVVLANEVLDALPFERFVCRDGRPLQLAVGLVNGRLGWIERAAPPAMERAVASIESDIGSPLPDGYVSEVCLAAEAWVGDVVSSVSEGLVLLFDYGVDRRSYYAPDRDEGWLRCHFRHHAHNDALLYPGIQDLTTWIDFSAIAGAAVTAGAEIAGYVSQAHFLVSAGLDEELAGLDLRPAEERMRLASEVRLLTLPGEMGEHVKCLGLVKGDVAVPAALTAMDRTHSL